MTSLLNFIKIYQFFSKIIGGGGGGGPQADSQRGVFISQNLVFNDPFFSENFP
jgi:hypothetical protein